VIEADGIQPVSPDLQTDGAFRMPIEEPAQSPVGDAPSGCRATLGLLELVAILGVVEEVREI
jgi:hypothetical protein